MTGIPPSTESLRIAPEQLIETKARGERIPCLTAYDYPMARLLDEAGIPLLLVGDSLGMVVLGYPNTTHVTMEHMVHHTAAVARAQPKALVVADLPFRSYESPDQAVENAHRLVEAGADAVKLEGGARRLRQIEIIRKANIPLMGHLGMLPQSVLEEGGYRKKGKTDAERNKLIEDAQALENAGAFGVVLELVVPKTARAITQAVKIPTIGIGSGERTCDGDILVTHDLLGLFPWFRPAFVKSDANLAASVHLAVEAYHSNVKSTPEAT